MHRRSCTQQLHLRDGRGEAILLNVQPLLPAHAAWFTSRASREALRAERSAEALAGARSMLDAAGVSYRAVTAAGRVVPPPERSQKTCASTR